MSQRDNEKVEMMKDIPRKEEFQKYLEKAGVIDQLTKLLVSLYENPDRPENALDYIKQFLGANHGQSNVECPLSSLRYVLYRKFAKHAPSLPLNGCVLTLLCG